MGEKAQTMTNVNSPSNGKNEFTKKRRRMQALLFAITAPIAMMIIIGIAGKPETIFSFNALLQHIVAGTILTSLLLVIVGGVEVSERYAPKAILKLKKYREQLIETKAVLHEIKGLKQTINQMRREIDSIHDTKPCLELKCMLENHLSKEEQRSTEKNDPKFIAKVIYDYGSKIKNLENRVSELTKLVSDQKKN